MSFLLRYLPFLVVFVSCLDHEAVVLERKLENTNSAKSSLRSWGFTNSANYTFDSNYVDLDSGSANLKAIDLSHTGADFSNGTHRGSFY